MKEQLIESAIALIAGMGTVFVVLILISLVISSFKYMNIGDKVKSNKEKSDKSAGVDVSSIVEVKDDSMGRIVAAITVALSEELNVPSDRLRIRKIQRLGKL